MGKNEFLSELEKSLSVLREDELRDIISEYEQHIDIKVEKGLTEEEVIADFGSLSELTGEILEAYHVRVDYAAGRGKSRKKSSKVLGQESSENLQKLREMGEKGGTTLKSGVKGWSGQWCGYGGRHADLLSGCVPKRFFKVQSRGNVGQRRRRSLRGCRGWRRIQPVRRLERRRKEAAMRLIEPEKMLEYPGICKGGELEV